MTLACSCCFFSRPYRPTVELAALEHGRETWTLMPAAVPGGAVILFAKVPE